MTPSILIITSKKDFSVDYIVNKLNSQKIPYYRFNTEDIGRGLDIEFLISENSFILHDKYKNLSLNLLSFSAVYYRRPVIAPFPRSLTTEEGVYFYNEHYTLLEFIYHLLQNQFWLNDVYDIRFAENKPYQLMLAQNIGFRIPESIISNISRPVRSLHAKYSNIIFKPLKMGLIKDGEKFSSVLFTTRVDNIFLEALDSIVSLPTYFQQEIRKKYDVRVTVVGQEVFAAFICSQEKVESQLDWRRTKQLLPHKQVKLPLEIEQKCLTLCKELNLQFAAIDLIYDLLGNYWFLEVNPNGQWVWIEQLLGYPISDRIIKILCEGKSNAEAN